MLLLNNALTPELKTFQTCADTWLGCHCSRRKTQIHGPRRICRKISYHIRTREGEKFDFLLFFIVFYFIFHIYSIFIFRIFHNYIYLRRPR